MFTKQDTEKIKNIEFSDEFDLKMRDKSKVIFGYNGIGKSTIYEYIKNKYPQYEYLDYKEMRNSFLKNKNNVVIGSKIQNITKLKNEIEELHNSNKVVDMLKLYDCNSVKKVKDISEHLSKVQKDKKISKITISDEKIKLMNNVLIKQFRNEFVSNYKKIKEISNIDEQIRMINNLYMNNALTSLLNLVTEEVSVCPACDTTDVENLNEKLKNKIKKLNEDKRSIFENFKFNLNDNKDRIIEEIIELTKNLNAEELTDLIICDFDIKRKKVIKTNLEDIEKKEIEISNLEDKLKEQYNNIKKEQEEIVKYFKGKFDIYEIDFDDEKYEIKITFNRDVSTYSEGELHLLMLLFKLYEYKINDADLLVMDDPITSYDLINQYKTLFEIVTLAMNKRVLIFTHNLEVINIINTQRKKVFEYQYFEKYEDKLYLQDINIKDKDSIIKLDNLLSEDKEKYLYALIEREKKEGKEKDNYDKIFHYDGSYSYNINGKELSNEYFVKLIDNFELQRLINKNFIKNSYIKIMYMCAIRVWIEKKFYEKIVLDNNLKYIENEIKDMKFGEKIERLLPVGGINSLNNHYLELSRTFLMSKKVMLNQNNHYQSQITTFNYALNISLDDLKEEIIEIKSKFL